MLDVADVGHHYDNWNEDKMREIKKEENNENGPE